MTTTTQPTAGSRPAGNVGQPSRLASYTIDEQTRVLWGQRIDGVVRVSDHPEDGQPGRRYIIERGLEQDGYGALLALVQDYIAQAVKHRSIPAVSTPVDRYLAALA
jgi:hypothetical protein